MKRKRALNSTITFKSDKMKTTKKLTNSGTSLVINVTMEARIMGLNRGDYMEIDIKPAVIKTCNNCGNCRGWHDEGYGYGEYICSLDETPGGCPEEINGVCPGWIPVKDP